MASIIKKPRLRAVHMGLYPTMNNLDEVINLGKAKLPITDSNDLVSLLMTMQNTVLKDHHAGVSIN